MRPHWGRTIQKLIIVSTSSTTAVIELVEMFLVLVNNIELFIQKKKLLWNIIQSSFFKFKFL